MKNVLLTAVALCAVSAPAYAQDASNFGGAKIGAVIGYDKVRLEVAGDSGSKDGFLYGLTAGYDFDLGSVVVGIEGEVSDATTKERETDILVVGDEASLRAGRDLYVGARVGFPVSQNVMLYAKGGYTNAKLKASYDDGVTALSDSENLDGWRIGAGAEYVNGSMFGRLEYRYSDYENIAAFGDTIETSRHQVAVVGGWRF